MPNNPNAVNPFGGIVSQNGYQRIAGTCAQTDMIQLFTGNRICMVKIVNVATIGFPLNFFLTYNSLDSVSGPVGNLWRHNYMMNLIITGSPATYVVLVSQTGRQYGFAQSGGGWALDTASNYGYYSGVLSQVSSNWQMTFPDGSYYTFDSSGVLTSLTDKHGNVTTLTYSGGNLTTVTEPTGRTISLSYTSGLLTGVTDPNSNSTTLTYDGDDNLTSVVGPAGCTTSFGYSTPSNHLLTSRTDGLGNTYSFTYDVDARLTGVTDPNSAMLQYTYTTYTETIGVSDTQNFAETDLGDARGNTWRYIFDLSGNLRRIIRPNLPGDNANAAFMYWDQILTGQGISQQKLLYNAAGTAVQTPSDAQSTWRSAYDSTNNNGDMLQSFDQNGMVTQYTYDSSRNLTSRYAGQAHLGVQGNWTGTFGSEGWVLCAFENDTSDVEDLPSFVSSLNLTDFTRVSVASGSTGFNNLIDPRTLVSADSLQRGIGFWQFSGSSPQITLDLTGAESFNLSLYTCANNLALQDDSPLAYNEQFGYDMTFSVTDKNGTQTFRCYNNAPGVWVTFPVQGDATHPITVTVTPSGAGTLAQISAMAFDPYDSHQTTYMRLSSA